MPLMKRNNKSHLLLKLPSHDSDSDKKSKDSDSIGSSSLFSCITEAENHEKEVK